MYVEFMKNFLLADSSELLAVTSSWKIRISPIRASWWLLELFRSLSPKTFDSYFLDMMYVKLMKNFYLADSSELMAVRVISASWAQKRLIPTF